MLGSFPGGWRQSGNQLEQVSFEVPSPRGASFCTDFGGSQLVPLRAEEAGPGPSQAVGVLSLGGPGQSQLTLVSSAKILIAPSPLSNVPSE